MLRLTWFLDFTGQLLKYLYEDRKISVSTAAKTAYNEALGIYHPLIVKTAANLAMMACPGREKLLKSLFPLENDDNRYKLLKNIIDLINPIREFLWKYFKDNDLTKLP